MKEFTLKELNKNNQNQLIHDLECFIYGYYEKLKPNIDKPIMLVNKSTLLFLIHWKIELSKFDEFLENNQNLKTLVYCFLRDNLLHYSATIKFKEQIDDYQKQLDKLDTDINVQFVNDYDPTPYLNQIDHKKISANMGLDSDVSNEDMNEIFKDVETF